MTADQHTARPRRAAASGLWMAPVAQETVHATVHVPGSKSATNRALVLAALADGPSTIEGGLDARDTRLMREALRALGVTIDDQDERRWQITPPVRFHGGASIDCGLSGTVMRFVPPIAAIADAEVSFHGDEAAGARPMGPLLDALSDLGAEVSTGDTLPFTISGRPDLPGGPVNVDASTSSQYVSALLLTGAHYARGVDVRHTGTSVPSLPHIAMTVAMLRSRGVEVDDSEKNRWQVRPGPIEARDISIEPDLTNAAVFLAAAAITGGRVTVADWPADSVQPGARIADILAAFGAEVSQGPDGLTVIGTNHLRGVDLDLHDASELTPVVAALAAVARDTSHIRGVAHIRGHETDRLQALHDELNNLGSHVVQNDDGLTIHPRVLHGGEWRTYADHRMAHAGALLGLLVEDVTLDDIGCTDKTMPQFAALWEDMLTQSDRWLDTQLAEDDPS